MRMRPRLSFSRARIQKPARATRRMERRECEIRVERAVAGSGFTEFTGAKGILDLH